MSDVSKTNELIAEARAEIEKAVYGAPDNHAALIRSGDVDDNRLRLLVRLADALDAATSVPVQGEPNDDRCLGCGSAAEDGHDDCTIKVRTFRATGPDAATEELETLRDIAETHAFCADRLSIETERADRVAREVCDRGCSYTGGPDEECSAHGRTPRELWEFIAQDIVGRDAATERAEKAEAERDAALAAAKRVRAAVNGPHPANSGLDSFTLAHISAALDGAPEPEWEERLAACDEHGTHCWSCKRYTERRRPAGEWHRLPVEGEKP